MLQRRMGYVIKSIIPTANFWMFKFHESKARIFILFNICCFLWKLSRVVLCRCRSSKQWRASSLPPRKPRWRHRRTCWPTPKTSKSSSRLVRSSILGSTESTKREQSGFTPHSYFFLSSLSCSLQIEKVRLFFFLVACSKLPHPYLINRTEGRKSEVCLFVKDVREGRKFVDAEDTIPHYEELLASKGVDCVSKVCSYRRFFFHSIHNS